MISFALEMYVPYSTETEEVLKFLSSPQKQRQTFIAQARAF